MTETTSILVVLLCIAFVIFVALSGLTWFWFFKLPVATVPAHIISPMVPAVPAKVTVPVTLSRVGLTVSASNSPAMTQALVSLQAFVTALQRLSCEQVSSASSSFIASQSCTELKTAITRYLSDMFAVIGPKFSSDLGKFLDAVIPNACSNDKPDPAKIQQRFDKTFCAHFDGGGSTPGKIGYAFAQDPAGFTPEVMAATQTLFDDGQQYACSALTGIQMTSDDSHTACMDTSALDMTTFTADEQLLLLKYNIPALLDVFARDLMTAFGCSAPINNQQQRTFDASYARKLVVGLFCPSS